MIPKERHLNASKRSDSLYTARMEDSITILGIRATNKRTDAITRRKMADRRNRHKEDSKDKTHIFIAKLEATKQRFNDVFGKI